MANPKGLPVSISIEGTRGTHTGRWGVMKPLFGEKPSPCTKSCPGSVDIPGFTSGAAGPHDRITIGDVFF